jgi:hypothetical protein
VLDNSQAAQLGYLRYKSWSAEIATVAELLELRVFVLSGNSMGTS